MAKFKVGDEVKVSTKGLNGADGIFTIKEIDASAKFPYKLSNNVVYSYTELELINAPKSLDTLEVGDVLVDKEGDRRWVLGVCGKVVFLSYWNQPNRAGNYYTVQELKEGYTLESPEPVKVSKQEIAAWKNTTVELLEVTE